MTRIQEAIDFAVMAHGKQVRKYTGLPYVVHTQAVAGIVASVTDDEDMIIAAHCHDCCEDCPVTIEDIRRNFGDRVAMLVEGLTDVSKPGDGNRATRKAIDREHTKNAGPDVHTIKLADILDNGQDISRNDPDFAVVYMREMEQLIPFLSDGNPILFKRASEQLASFQLKSG